jgi:hypothetical protein
LPNFLVAIDPLDFLDAVRACSSQEPTAQNGQTKLL